MSQPYPLPTSPVSTPQGSLPDPMTGSRTNASAAAPLTDNVVAWAQNFWAAPRCPTIPTAFDTSSQSPGGQS